MSERTKKDFLHIEARDALKTAGILAAACLFCLLMRGLGGETNYASVIFILAVFIVARFTNGYACGILASIIGVLAVNYLFTYPYLRFNFTITGYPLMVLCMLVVSLTTSTLTTKTKQSESIRLMAEREKMRGNLLRAVSHDLRTPLTSIMGATSAVIENDESLSSEERKSLLRGAQDDAGWLIRMVENLLAVTRIDADSGAKIVKTPEPVEEIVSGAVAKFKSRFPKTAVEVSVPNELLFVPMDAVLIEQVLINLLENSVIHGVSADLIKLNVKREGDSAVFEITDNGVGIDPAKLRDLFNGSLPGSQTSDAESRRSMGIGLSVCSTIVAAHGGTMSAFNPPDGGAVFRFKLGMKEEI